jgi:hypothetical protein
LRKNMSPTAISGFLCCAKQQDLETNIRFVRDLLLNPTGCYWGVKAIPAAAEAQHVEIARFPDRHVCHGNYDKAG